MNTPNRSHTGNNGLGLSSYFLFPNSQFLSRLQPPLCYRRWSLFVYVSRIAKSSGRNWVGLYDVSVSYGCSKVHVIFFHCLPSWAGCNFQGNLFSIFKLFCLVFVRYYLSSCTALENCVLFVIALRSSWENFFAKICFAHASH